MNKTFNKKLTHCVAIKYRLSVLVVLIAICSIFNALAQPLLPIPVPPTESTISSDFAGVVDYAKLIDPARTDELNALLRDLKQKTTASIVVLTVKTGAETLDRTQAESYAARIYTEWNLAHSPLDNTVLFLVTAGEAPQSVQPVVYQGRAMREVIDDQKTEKLLDKFFVPATAQQDYTKGIYETTWALALLLAQSYRTTLSGTPPFEGDPLTDGANASQTTIWLLVLVLIAAFLYQRIQRRRAGESTWLPWRIHRKSTVPRISYRGSFDRAGFGDFGTH